MKKTTRVFLGFLAVTLGIVSLSGCKFGYGESDYLGTYTGTFDSETPIYTSCNGQAIIYKAGPNLVNIELITDSNPTFYFLNLDVDYYSPLGFATFSMNGPGAGGEEIYVSIDPAKQEMSASIYFPVWSDAGFNGTKQ